MWSLWSTLGFRDVLNMSVSNIEADVSVWDRPLVYAQ